MIFDKPLRQRSRSGIAQEQGAPGSPEVGG